MNEPKKRGRPPKQVIAAIEQAVMEAPGAGGPMSVFLAKSHGSDEQNPEFARRQAQAYARRVWSGQSESVPRKERLARVSRALEAQGLSMEGVELP